VWNECGYLLKKLTCIYIYIYIYIYIFKKFWYSNGKEEGWLDLICLCLCGFCSSQECQQSHWRSGHKIVCKDFHQAGARSPAQNGVINRGFKSSAAGGKSSSAIALIPARGTIYRPIKQPKDVSFFYWCNYKFMLCALLTVVCEREGKLWGARFYCLEDDVQNACSVVKKIFESGGEKENTNTCDYFALLFLIRLIHKIIRI